MTTILEIFTAFLLGGSAYGAIEVLWRGHTHWTMLLAGGVCFALIYLIASRLALPRWQQYILCAAAITTVEFVTGAIINRGLGWNVWDYSSMRWNLCGQICARYSLYWLLLSIPGCALARSLFRLFLRVRRSG
jgi:uncharacterized membrane protein